MAKTSWKNSSFLLVLFPFRYTPMVNSNNKFETLVWRLMKDHEGGTTGNIESQLRV